MKSIFILTALIGITLVGCKKSDDVGTPTIALQNEPPLSFNLMEVPDGSIKVDVVPTLSWESAKNPEGGEVSYGLYLDTSKDPSTLYEENINTTSFELTERLNLSTDYYWKIVATDSDERTSQSPIHKFSTRDVIVPQTAVTKAAAFSPRFGHTSVAFDDKLWLIGGFGNSFQNDIWESNDGVLWTEVNAVNHFSARRNHASVIFDNKIWVIGGQTNFNPGATKSTHLSNDVWYSENGIDWTLATPAAQFSKRSRHTVTVFNNLMWLIGGDGMNDVWYSSDGITWVKAHENAPFSERSGHSSITFDNALWLIGGNDYTKSDAIWSSKDGVQWVEVKNHPHELSSLFGHTTLTFDSKIWLIGGAGPFGILNEYVWSSTDGHNWVKVDKEIPFIPRRNHSTTVFKNILWILAGYDLSGDSGTLSNEIWTIK